MKTQHTPGPWKTGDANWRIIVGPHTRFKNGRLSGVAAIDESDNLSEDISNARLIAAAPELLAALEACVSELNQLAFLANDKLANAVIQKGIDAICKAKESQP
jgi:hypothetical protein